jgi:hypothetical protein
MLNRSDLPPVADSDPADKPARETWQHAKTTVTTHRGWFAAVPVILVNTVAFGAQLGFWRVHLPVLGQAVLVALALESIAIYLAWQAHLAQLADDSALRLRMAAYGFALVIGVMNYSHYMAPGWRPTVAAVTFGMMSAVSPWLWSVHSRRQSRDKLRELDQLEPHAVRLGMTRWAWHPRRSAKVMFRATWLGVTRPADAIALLPEDEEPPPLPAEMMQALVLFAAPIRAGTLPTYPEVRAVMGCGQLKAGRIRRVIADATEALRSLETGDPDTEESAGGA